MSEELLGLLRLCKQNPDDDARRNLADWLEKNGQPERAEYVRLQLLPSPGLFNWYRGQETNNARELRLLKQHNAAWTNTRLRDPRRGFVIRDNPAADDDKKTRGPSGNFERGTMSIAAAASELPEVFQKLPAHALPWLEKLHVTVDSLEALAANITDPAMAEFTSIRLSGKPKVLDAEFNWLAWLDQPQIRALELPGKLLPPLAAAGQLRPYRLNVGDDFDWEPMQKSPLLSEVRFLSTSVPEESTVLIRLARIEQLGKLESLHLYTSAANYSAESLQALFAAPFMAGLTELNVCGETHGIGSALAKSPGLRKLKRLELAFNFISTADAVAMALSPLLANLRELKINGSSVGQMTPEGAAALLALPRYVELETLNLSNASIGDVGLCALARSPHMQKLRRLDVCRCGITGLGVKVLASSPHLADLEDIDLALNPLRDDALDVLANSTTLKNLRSLRIGSQNGNGDALVRLLKSPLLQQLERLYLKGANGAQVKALAEASLGNLRSLTLDETQLQPGEIDPLLEAPWLGGLVDLSLADPTIVDDGVRKLTANLRLGSLAKLSFEALKKNNLTDESAKILLAWPGLRRLVRLSLSDSISPVMQLELDRAVAAHHEASIVSRIEAAVFL